MMILWLPLQATHRSAGVHRCGLPGMPQTIQTCEWNELNMLSCFNLKHSSGWGANGYNMLQLYYIYIYIIYICTNYVHWHNSWYNMVQQMSTWQWRHCSAAWTTGCWVCRQERQHREPKAHRSSVNPPKAVSQEGVCCRKTMRKLWENLDAPWTLISFRNFLLLSM